MNKNIVVSGIKETDKENRKQVAQDLLHHKLQLRNNIPIEDAFRVGAGQFRPLIIKLNSIEDRNAALKNKTLLKAVRNEERKKIFVDALLPEELNEKQRKQRQLMA